MSLRDRLALVLKAAQQQRELRPDWIAFEQQTMLAAVNAERASLGKPAVSLEDIQRAERPALGHVDYSSKFALYCAELVTETSGEKR